MAKTFGWIVGLVGLMLLGVGGRQWTDYVATHSTVPMKPEDWAYLAGSFLPSVVLIAIGYGLSQKS